MNKYLSSLQTLLLERTLHCGKKKALPPFKAGKPAWEKQMERPQRQIGVQAFPLQFSSFHLIVVYHTMTAASLQQVPANCDRKNIDAFKFHILFCFFSRRRTRPAVKIPLSTRNLHKILLR